MINNNNVNLSELYARTIGTASEDVWWNIVNTLGLYKNNELMYNLLQSFPNSDVQKRSQFEKILKSRSVCKSGLQNNTLNMRTLIKEIINYIWSNSNFNTVFNNNFFFHKCCQCLCNQRTGFQVNRF